MSQKSDKGASALEKIASFIVDKRKAFYLIYIIIAIFCLFSMNWVKVNNDLTDYLSEDTETRRGINVMDEEFYTYATARIMVDNITYKDALRLSEEIEEIDGIKEIAFDDTADHYTGASALFSITFDGASDDEICKRALDEAEEMLSDYEIYVSAELGDTEADTIAKEMTLVMLIAVVIIVTVLLFTSRTYMEVPVLLITFAMAALMNKGSNFMFGTISFISDSIAVVLQLALAIDYAIILCHRYTEERVRSEPREAVIAALCKSIPEIAGSSLTTLSGLGAMAFMHFKIGYDMSIVLMKSILLSILSVFTLMPGLLLSMSGLIDKTHHKSFIPKITFWGKAVVKLRYITAPVFIVLAAIAFFLSSDCPYAYSYSRLSTIKENESQIADRMIDESFGTDNILAVIVPKGDYEKEQKLYKELESYEQTTSVTGLASVEAADGYLIGDKLTPREFSELAGIDIEMADMLYSAYAASHEEYGKIVGGIESYTIPLLDLFEFAYEKSNEGYVNLDDEIQDNLNELNETLEDGKKQLMGSKHSRLVINLNLPEESEETFEFLNTVRDTAKKYYGDDVLLAGNSTSDFDLSSTFGLDNTLISILSFLFVLLILLMTFQSAGVPIIQLMVIQGSIWMNFSFPTLHSSPMFFMSYLVVSSIQMGANIDYAIVITNRYTQLREEMPAKEAVIMAIEQAFPTILTSGSILASAGIAIGLLSSNPAISSIGICLGRGTIISIVLVMLILPQLLMLGDIIIEKTSFSVNVPLKKIDLSGNVLIDGHIHGYVNGRVDGTFTGKISGNVDASVTGSKSKSTKEPGKPISNDIGSKQDISNRDGESND